MTDVPPMHFANWIQRHAVTRPNVAALVVPNKRLSYFEFNRAIHVAAHRLAAMGVKRGHTVGLCVYNQALNCVLIAALNRMGVVSVNLTAQQGAPLKAPETIELANIVVDEPFQGIAPDRALRAERNWLDAEAGEAWQAPGFADENEIVRIFLTSGTTGNVKAVGQSTRQIEARVFKYTIGTLAQGGSQNRVTQVGVRSTAGFRAVFATFWAGGTLYLGWPERHVPHLIARNNIENILASPAQYQTVVSEAQKSGIELSSLRSCWVTGSGAPRSLIEAIRARLSPNLVNIYGSTELGMMAFGLLHPQRAAVAGVLAPWVEAEAVDEDDSALPAGSGGALRFRSAEMVTGYMGDADATARHFKDGWFYPGDTGKISADGVVTLTGRSADQINAGGVKVSPDLVEDAVLAYPGIEECAAFGAPDAAGVEKVWVAIVAPKEVDLEKLARQCAAKLGPRAPHRFLRLGQIPRNESGKVLRRELMKLAADDGEASRAT